MCPIANRRWDTTAGSEPREGGWRSVNRKTPPTVSRASWFLYPFLILPFVTPPPTVCLCHMPSFPAWTRPRTTPQKSGFLPPEAGKTTTFMSLLGRLQSSSGDPKATRSLVIVNRVKLARRRRIGHGKSSPTGLLKSDEGCGTPGLG